jgi:excisionase family DNA binding protein
VTSQIQLLGGLRFSREELLSPTELASVLRIERSTAVLYMRRGLLPACKIGRHWLSPQPLLDQFLTSLFGLGSEARLRFIREDLVTPDLLASALRVERSTAMTYMRRGIVPARKIGRFWYSPRPLLDEYLGGLFGLETERTF